MRLGKARTQPEPQKGVVRTFVKPGQVLLTITSPKGHMARLVMDLDDVVKLSNMILAAGEEALALERKAAEQ